MRIKVYKLRQFYKTHTLNAVRHHRWPLLSTTLYFFKFSFPRVSFVFLFPFFYHAPDAKCVYNRGMALGPFDDTAKEI